MAGQFGGDDVEGGADAAPHDADGLSGGDVDFDGDGFAEDGGHRGGGGVARVRELFGPRRRVRQAEPWRRRGRKRWS